MCRSHAQACWRTLQPSEAHVSQSTPQQTIEAVQQTALRNNGLGAESGWDISPSAGSLEKATLESQTLDAEVLPLMPDRVDNLLGAFVEDQWSLPIAPEPLVEPERVPVDTFWETVVEVGL